MTRNDLANQNIEKLESIEEAIELVSLLDYDECLAVLNRTNNIPHELFKALVDKAKSLKGMTLDLLIASMQNIAN